MCVCRCARFLFRFWQGRGRWERGRERDDRWSCGKKELISRVKSGGRERGIEIAERFGKKSLFCTFDDFIIPPSDGGVAMSPFPFYGSRDIRCSVGKKGNDVEGREQWRGIETRYDTTRFLHGRGTSIGPYKTVPLFLVYSFVPISPRLFSKRLRFLLRRRVVSKVGETFNGTNSARDERGGGSIFSSNVLLATLITRTALRCLISIVKREVSRWDQLTRDRYLNIFVTRIPLVSTLLENFWILTTFIAQQLETFRFLRIFYSVYIRDIECLTILE